MKKIVILVPDQVHKSVKRYALDNDTSMVESVLTSLKKNQVITQNDIDSE